MNLQWAWASVTKSLAAGSGGQRRRAVGGGEDHGDRVVEHRRAAVDFWSAGTSVAVAER